jgi:hypothetical protein
MSRSAGTYTLPSNSWNPAVEGTAIDESDWNEIADDLEAAVTESVYTGGLGSTDNCLIRTDGTDTKKAQGTTVVCSDTNDLSGIVKLTLSGGLILTEGALTLANGANTDVVLPTGTFVAITGPSGAFSVNSFASPVSGRVLILYNSTAQNMTITNDATGTAANRILTLTGADVALTGTSLATLVYSAVSSRWILVSTQG